MAQFFSSILLFLLPFSKFSEQWKWRRSKNAFLSFANFYKFFAYANENNCENVSNHIFFTVQTFEHASHILFKCFFAFPLWYLNEQHSPVIAANEIVFSSTFCRNNELLIPGWNIPRGHIILRPVLSQMQSQFFTVRTRWRNWDWNKNYIRSRIALDLDITEEFCAHSGMYETHLWRWIYLNKMKSQAQSFRTKFQLEFELFVILMESLTKIIKLFHKFT